MSKAVVRIHQKSRPGHQGRDIHPTLRILGIRRQQDLKLLTVSTVVLGQSFNPIGFVRVLRQRPRPQVIH